MISAYHPRLRVRLIRLVLIAVLPALILILYSAGEQRRKDSQMAKRESLRLVRVVAASQQRLVDSTRQLLIALSLLPEVHGRDPRACNDLFAKLLKQYPLYANLGAADVNGREYCSGQPVTKPINIGDRSYFQLAVQRRNFAIGDYQIGRITGKASLNLGYPILEKDGSVAGVVFAALDLAPLNQLVSTANLPDQASLAVYDRDGTLLVHFPAGEQLVGKSVPEADIVQTALAQKEGVTEANGLDGRPRLYGFIAIGDDSDQGQILLHIGIPKDVALADADRLLKRNLAALLLVTLLALVAAWYGGDVFVLRRLHALVDTTERFGSGDLGARTGLAHQPDEFGRLAASFDRMADSIEARRREAVTASQQLQRNLERIKALHDIDMAIISTLDLQPMLKLVLEKVDVILPGAVTTIRLLNKDTKGLEPTACRNLDERAWRAGNPRPMYGFAKIVMENKCPLTVANVQTDPRADDHHFARRFGLVSYLGVPLIAKDKLLGVIAFYTKEAHAFNDEEIEFLTTLAGQSAMAIHNAMLHQETRRSAEELSALHELTIATTRTLDLEQALRSAIQKISEIFHFDAARIFLFDSEMSELRVAAAYEAESELWKSLSRFSRGQGIVGRVAETTEPVIFEDIENDPRYQEYSDSKILAKTGAKFLAALPIATKLKTWGVVVIVGKGSRRLQPNELRLLNSMTHQIGIAVENATLYSQTAAKAKELSALYSIAGIAGESLDINIVLRKTMNKVLEIFDYDAARIYLRNDDSGELHLVAHQGIPEEVPLLPTYKIGRGRLSRAIETGDAMFVEDMASDPLYNQLGHNKYMLKAGFRSVFVIPLKVRGEVLGVMSFAGKNPHPFAETDVQLINAIAYHLGVAVGNSRLFSQLRKQTVELEKASQGKDEFLGVISHELRTPLNVIKGYTEIMTQGILGDINEEQRKALETIDNQSIELLNMINGVLQVTRIEAGAIQAAAVAVNLGDFLEELRRNYGIPSGKDLTVTWDFPGDLPVIETDDEKLKAVIQNLVNNAIKFTDKGRIGVTVRHLTETKHIEFTVADTGIGIPAEKISAIFDMFQQADSSVTRKFGGVGLGLYIVRKYTELLGGQIAVASELGRGSTFTVTLPIVAKSRESSSRTKTIIDGTNSLDGLDYGRNLA